MKKQSIIILYLIIFLIFILFISIFFIGRYNIDFHIIFDLNNSEFKNLKQVLLYIRLPRIIAALLVGAALSVSGATYQAVFKNPMVSPDILGASSGSAFGIAFSIIMHFNYVNTILFSFFTGIIAVFLSYSISKLLLNDRKFSLILSGIMISTIFSSLLSYIKLIADIDNELPDITYWLMGRLSGVTYKTIFFSSFLLIFGIIAIFMIRWRINIFTLGGDEINTLGINIERNRFFLIAAATLLTSLTVSICGIIGFVGLVIPHFARLLVGNNYKNLIPTTIFGGAIFLIIIDDLARTISSYEVPIGILTSVVGAPIFLFLMVRDKYA